jgi:hypothetical protein
LSNIYSQCTTTLTVKQNLSFFLSFFLRQIPKQKKQIQKRPNDTEIPTMQEPANTKNPLTPKTRPSQCDETDNENDTHEMSTSNHCTQLSFLPTDPNDEESTRRDNMEEEMKLEKERYPGAKSWAPAEERLFEILFMRQDLPMLPTTWDIDLRGIPISDVVFQTSEDCPPIIYAHLKNFAGMFSPT